ncbi:hypothetical protein L3Q82_023546, partial [Scortum barcoo]
QPFLNPEGGSECDVVLLNRWSVRKYQVQRGDIVSVISRALLCGGVLSSRLLSAEDLGDGRRASVAPSCCLLFLGRMPTLCSRHQSRQPAARTDLLPERAGNYLHVEYFLVHPFSGGRSLSPNAVSRLTDLGHSEGLVDDSSSLQRQQRHTGIRTITDYKPPLQTCDSSTPLLNELNDFFARFEAHNSTPAQKSPPPPGEQVLTLSPDSVRRTLGRINARKASGPDNIPGCVLRDCAAELTDVFTDNISLSQAVIPACLKTTTIIPVPKKSLPSCFNDYGPVALTPILMKCFKRLVLKHISSAFNTIIPQQLILKLDQLGLNTSLCNWLLDFLTGRPQAVQVGRNTSSITTLNTGASQGCVLSPLLFTLLTHDCTPLHSSNLLIKFADNTTVAGLITNDVTMRQTTGASSTKFLGVHVTEDLSWTINTTSLAKKANQRLYFLRKLRKAGAPAPIMCTFYRGTIESVLTSSITVWYGACSASCRKTLQFIVKTLRRLHLSPHP